MTDYLTYTARAKLKRLLAESPGFSAIRLQLRGELQLSLEFVRGSLRGEITICSNPHVLVDHQTFTRLVTGAVDFDYQRAEFIIRPS